jgi:hypothetical protein
LAGLQAVFSAEEPVDPPASLAEAITRSITLPQPAAAATEPRNGPSSNFIKTGSVEPIIFKGSKTMARSNGRKWLVLGACSVPVVVVLAMAAQNFSVDESQVSGTIAPAQRYLNNQVSADDPVAGTGSGGGSGGSVDEGSVEGKGLEGKGLEGKGLEGKGLEGKGLEGKGLEGKGLEGKGLEGKGLEGKGNDKSPAPVSAPP